VESSHNSSGYDYPDLRPPSMDPCPMVSHDGGNGTPAIRTEICEAIMKIGDLVQHRDSQWKDWFGVIVRQIPGTDQRQVVYWSRDFTCSYPKQQLQVLKCK